MIEKIHKALHARLTPLDLGLVGCQRRQQWMAKHEAPWRWIRGNALLEMFAEKRDIETQVGIMQVWVYEGHLCMYRAGPWNLHWTEDFYDTLALCMWNSSVKNDIIVLHEDKGILDIKHIKTPPTFDTVGRILRMGKDWDKTPRGRISKATSHAVKVCRFCPVKVRCDAHDKIRGEISDWSTAYPTP